MAISKAMLKRGDEVGLEPKDGESSSAFSARVRKAEKETPAQPSTSGGGWRRF